MRRWSRSFGLGKVAPSGKDQDVVESDNDEGRPSSSWVQQWPLGRPYGLGSDPHRQRP